jgi:hypothetical protein
VNVSSLHLCKNLSNKWESFTAGNVAINMTAWYKITSDRWILRNVKHGCKIDFDCEKFDIPNMIGTPPRMTFSESEQRIIEEQLSSLLHQNVIEIVEQTPCQVLSNIFLRPKKDGTHRLILNLKPLNQFVTKKNHFKMET